MSADAINPVQLQLLMRPHEVLDAVQGSVDYGAYDVQGGMGRKKVEAKLRGDVLHEAKRPGRAWTHPSPSTYESVRDEGIYSPITLTPGDDYEHALMANVSTKRAQSRTTNFYMGNGHHRLAAAMEIERETGGEVYIPVQHHWDYMGGQM